MSYQPGLFGKRLLPRDVHDLLYRNGWTEPLNMTRMVATVQAESQFYSEAVGQVNSDGSQDFGLFQLNNGHWKDFAPSHYEFVELSFDPEKAVKVARQLWHDDVKAGGTGFRPWAAFNSGAYKEFVDVACRALCNFSSVKLLGKPII